ncbi:MAG: response regulator [Candidatus Omnitrophota bacterium]
MPEKKKILIVDDEKDFCEMIKINLEATGKYTVRSEIHGSSTLSAVLVFKPDLILLDIAIGDMDGSQVAYEIKNSDYGKDIPIVYISGIIKLGQEHSLHNYLGGFPLLSKPIAIADLINCIEENTNKG